jgi:8-oxo-dGTP diphosphatase
MKLYGTKVVVLNTGDQILLLKRADHLPSPGRWDFCGGGVDQDESPEEAALREVQEESSLTVTELTLLFEENHKEGENDVTLYFYSAITDQDDISLSDEHSEYKWFTLQEINKLQLPDAMEEAIQKVQQNIGV